MLKIHHSKYTYNFFFFFIHICFVFNCFMILLVKKGDIERSIGCNSMINVILILLRPFFNKKILFFFFFLNFFLSDCNCIDLFSLKFYYFKPCKFQYAYFLLSHVILVVKTYVTYMILNFLH